MNEVALLQAELANLYATLATISTVIDGSAGGNTVNAAATRQSCNDRIKEINIRLAQLSGPFAITSVARHQ